MNHLLILRVTPNKGCFSDSSNWGAIYATEDCSVFAARGPSWSADLHEAEGPFIMKGD